MSKTDKDRIKEYTLLDDIFFRACMKDNIEAIQEILRIILNKPKLKVLEIKTQDDLVNLRGRSLIIDVHAVDENKVHYNIEVENSATRANVKRIRYHSSLLDSSILNPGDDFKKNLTESIVIFITKDDIFKKGAAIYPGEFVYYFNDEPFSSNDGRKSYVVNASYHGKDKLGDLMHDFRSPDYKDIHSEILKEAVKNIKETKKGNETIMNISEQLRQEGRLEGLLEGRQEGRREGILEGRQEGKLEGILEGKQEGKQEANYETAKALFTDNIDFNKVAKYCPNIATEELHRIQLEVLNQKKEDE